MGGGISGASLNVSKRRKSSGYPSAREGEIFEILVNTAMAQGLPEHQAQPLAKIALPLIFKSEGFATMRRHQGAHQK